MSYMSISNPWQYEPSYSDNRAIIAYFRDFYGEFTLDKLDLYNSWGIS